LVDEAGSSQRADFFMLFEASLSVFNRKQTRDGRKEKTSPPCLALLVFGVHQRLIGS
jgi:hypothetical protein